MRLELRDTSNEVQGALCAVDSVVEPRFTVVKR